MTAKFHKAKFNEGLLGAARGADFTLQKVTTRYTTVYALVGNESVTACNHVYLNIHSPLLACINHLYSIRL